ncbi:ig-like domain-containing protein [Trichonephila inaurata madagascariensis]|uniref:Ig-like domain-containing protein n=1 Tax=Trichonephila inaurata madagascariensis TaxID=2747483 RepID=A0A8X6X689_9ARAC|nr:ig-like domain-containing protein [Trichonephila inaurata madagascariensis]
MGSCTRAPGGVSSNGSLVIAQSQESDAGVYACQVENGIGPGINKNIALKVNVPPKVSVPKGQLAIRKGEAARLVCDVTGNGPINVKWVKKQSVIEIHPGSRYVMILPPTLIHYSPLSIFAEGKVFQLFEEGSLKM